MKHEEEILWEISKRGDEFLQDIALLLFRGDEEKFPMEYGEHKEGDKGRDIIIYNSRRFYSEIIQVKHSKNSNNKFTKKKFLNELGKTLLHIVLDRREFKQNHIDFSTGIKFSILLNYKVDKKIMDINSEIKEDSSNVAKLLFNSVEKNKRFDNLKYEDIAKDLIEILNVLTITIYNSSFLYERIINTPAALFQFQNISFEISRLIDENKVTEIETVCKEKGMRFLSELEKIDYDKFSPTYAYAIEDYSKALSVFDNFSRGNLNKIPDNKHWEEKYKAQIRRRYNEKKEQYIRKLKTNELIDTCKSFYNEVVVNLEFPTVIDSVISDLYVEKGLYHLEIEEGNLKGWRLDE